MECLLMFAQSRAVAPPGRRLRVLMSSGGMPVDSLRRSAACRSGFVMCRALTVRWVRRLTQLRLSLLRRESQAAVLPPPLVLLGKEDH